MANQKSTFIRETSSDIAKHDGSGIELSHIGGNIYESLEKKDRDSHGYITTGEAVAAKKDRDSHGYITTREAVAAVNSDTNNTDSKASSTDTTKRVALSNLNVELPCQAICQVAVAAVLVCTLICTISGVIVYHVIYVKIAEIERSTLHNQGDIKLLLSRDSLTDMNRRLDTLEEKQTTSEMALSDYNANIDQRLLTVQEKQNISGQQVAFTAHGSTGTVVNTVLIFKFVILNAGDGYNQTTGKFTCPVAGTYLFSATILSVSHRKSQTACWIRKNASNIALVYNFEGTHESSSVSAIIHLTVGDLVDFGQCYRVENIVTTSGHCVFTGSLLQTD